LVAVGIGLICSGVAEGGIGVSVGIKVGVFVGIKAGISVGL